MYERRFGSLLHVFMVRNIFTWKKGSPAGITSATEVLVLTWRRGYARRPPLLQHRRGEGSCHCRGHVCRRCLGKRKHFDSSSPKFWYTHCMDCALAISWQSSLSQWIEQGAPPIQSRCSRAEKHLSFSDTWLSKALTMTSWLQPISLLLQSLLLDPELATLRTAWVKPERLSQE
jgi:hypothetical protein